MYGYGNGSWMHSSGMFGVGYAMILVWVVLIALLVAVVVFLARLRGRSSDRRSGLDTLKERYARGEIGKDEFADKKRDIAR